MQDVGVLGLRFRGYGSVLEVGRVQAENVGFTMFWSTVQLLESLKIALQVANFFTTGRNILATIHGCR